MKKTILLIVALLCCSGCTTINVSTKSLDGKTVDCTGSYSTFLQNVDASNLSACGGKSKSEGSRANTDLLQAVLKAALATP